VIGTIATWVIIGWALLMFIFAVFVSLLRFPGRTVDDVTSFLRQVDLEEAEMLLDPAVHFALRWNLSEREMKEMQRKRMHLYLEIAIRMAHNAGLMIELGNRELYGHQQERTVELVNKLKQEALQVRIYALVTILKLNILLAMRPVQTPSLAPLRKACAIDGIKSYKALRSASTALFEEFRRPLNVDF